MPVALVKPLAKYADSLRPEIIVVSRAVIVLWRALELGLSTSDNLATRHWFRGVSGEERI